MDTKIAILAVVLVIAVGIGFYLRNPQQITPKTTVQQTAGLEERADQILEDELTSVLETQDIENLENALLVE
ncbi:MAG: hypothetical protein J4428_01115 [Candidatus Aenigmarchaeota archaeon]|nr:hypothetical protein [Candidatus Aenigmarchaeota archaeon]